ncbi:MAG: DNA-binding domain-containing protein [Nevskia sp.]|nr:DNA-binding domain-containing protein [Nevskia sp.]
MSSIEITDSQCEALSLACLQSRMMAAVFGEPPEPTLLRLVRLRSGLGAEDQLAIYRHATAAILEQTLTLSYPATARILGDIAFAQLIVDYRATTPSRSGDLEVYGGDFGDFLGRLPLADIPRVAPDLARFEWLVAQLTRAPEKPVFDYEKLAAIPPDQLSSLNLALGPRAALFGSDHPVLATWSDADGVQHEQGDRLLLVCHDELRVIELSSDDWAFQSTLSAGGSLKEAVEAALNLNSDFDLGGALDRILRLGAFTVTQGEMAPAAMAACPAPSAP